MFNLNPSQSSFSTGVQDIAAKLQEYTPSAVVPFVQALQGTQKVQEMKLGLEMAAEHVGWTIFADNNSQMMKFVSQA